MLIKNGSRDHSVGFIGSSEVDDVFEDPEWSREYEPIQGLIFEKHDIRMDPTLSEQQQRSGVGGGDLGILSYSFGVWDIGLNWDTHWNEGIPPHHYRVRYRGTEVAILSPYFLVRTCPRCKLGNPTVANGRYEPEGLYLAHYCPRNPVTGAVVPKDWPACLPAHACRGPAYDGQLLGTCGGWDWFGGSDGIGLLLDSNGVEPRSVFQRDCAEELAKITDTDRWATDMATPDDLDSLNLVGDVGSSQESRIIAP